MIRGTRWEGEPLPGGSLLLQCEQGLGDTIQQARYIPMVAERLSRDGEGPAATIHLLCQPELQRLLGRNLPQARLVDRGEAEQMRASLTRVCSLFDLPAIFHPTGGAPATPFPYLSAGESPWPSRLASRTGPTVGLVWKGSQTHGLDKFRSVTLEELAPLTSTDGIRLVSLQVGPQALCNLALPPTLTMLDPTPEITDFDDTAAIVATLDLVITVDTSTAHLAGALGRPTWVFIPSEPDWRWMYHREDSPWYPTMRLFRQEPGEDWSAVVARMASALRDWVQQQADDPAARGVSPLDEAAARLEAPTALPAPPPPAPTAERGRRPRVLVVPLDHEAQASTRLGLQALGRLLPAEAERRVVPVSALDGVDGANVVGWADLVIVGVGDDLTPDLARDPALHRLVREAPQAVGIFGTCDAPAIDPAALASLIDGLRAWMARHHEDVTLFGRGRANVVHLGHWLVGGVPMVESSDPVLLVAGDPARADADLDEYARTIQRHHAVRATTPLALLTALPSAQRVLWSAPDAAIDALVLDVFGQRFPHGQWLDIDRAAVAAYRGRLRAVESGLAGLFESLAGLPR